MHIVHVLKFVNKSGWNTDIQKQNMVWTCDAKHRREDTSENPSVKNGVERPRGRPRTRWIYPIRKNIEIWRKIGRSTKKTVSGRIETAGDLSIILYP